MRRQPGRESFEAHARRYIPGLLGSVPFRAKLLGVVFLGIGDGQIGPLGAGRLHRGAAVPDQDQGTDGRIGCRGHGLLLLPAGIRLVLRLVGGLFLSQLVGANQPGDFFGVRRGAEDLARILLQRLDPACHVGDVLAGIVANAELLPQHHRPDLRPQLLARVAFRTEGMCQVACQTGRVARGVPQLVQRGRVVTVAAQELAALRQRDRVLGQSVEGPVTGNMPDRNTRIGQNRVGLGMPFPLGADGPQRSWRQPVDLLGIEHHGAHDAGPLVPHHLADRLTLLVEHRLALGVPHRLQALPFPELDGRAFLALADLGALLLRLAIGHPSSVGEAAGLRPGSSATPHSCRDTRSRSSGCRA